MYRVSIVDYIDKKFTPAEGERLKKPQRKIIKFLKDIKKHYKRYSIYVTDVERSKFNKLKINWVEFNKFRLELQIGGIYFNYDDSMTLNYVIKEVDNVISIIEKICSLTCLGVCYGINIPLYPFINSKYEKCIEFRMNDGLGFVSLLFIVSNEGGPEFYAPGMEVRDYEDVDDFIANFILHVSKLYPRCLKNQ